MNVKLDTDSIKGKVLVVDDKEIMCYSLQVSLENHDYQVVTTQKPREALAKIKQETFDVVLADIRMPGMDGIQLLKAIKKIHPQLPVIFMTAYPTEGLELGAEDCITKPLNNTKKILALLERVIAN